MKIKHLTSFILESSIEDITYNIYMNNMKIKNKKIILMMIADDNTMGDYCGDGQW